MNHRTISYRTCGISLSTVLTIVFVILKLTHVIDWKWVWVLCPLWISTGISIIIIIGVLIAMYIVNRR